MKKVLDYLQQLGLSEIEAKLYSELLQTGPTTVMELANHADIKRITAHFNIESLIQKGLVSQIKKGARRQISAESPERLSYLIEQKLETAKQLEEKLPDIIKVFHQAFPKTQVNKDVLVKYYEGKQAVQLVYEETLDVDKFYSFADLEKYYQIYPGTIDVWNEAFEDNPKREVWDLLVDSELSREIAKQTHKRHHIKFLPKSHFFSGFNFSDYIIYNSKVALVQLDPANVMATVIDSNHMALTLMALHRCMWDLLPEEEV